MNNERDYFTAMPCGYAHRVEVSMFDKLLLLKIFKPEKLMFAFQRYVGKALGKEYAESPVATMDALFGSSDNHTPIIFVLSQGADPTE
jgi:dynein heavy chain